MKIVLIGNYLADRQQSMQRFAECLWRELPQHGLQAEIWRPEPWLGRLKPSGHGLGKWLGYFDKFILFPRALRRRLAAEDPRSCVVHLCDHGNSMYSFHLRRHRCLTTCHDLLAVRGSLGEDTDCPASMAGVYLQRWILSGLKNSDHVACVSESTRRDLERLAGPRLKSTPSVILQGLNHGYQTISAEEAARRLQPLRLLDQPYLLHVGSSERRKNRDAVLRVMHRLKERWPGRLVFAGAALTGDLVRLKHQLGLQERVREILSPDNALLEALYNQAHALFFPSRFEGFGWPIIEAQACGCPVVCSDRTSLPEVAGEGALIRPVEDEEGFAADLLALDDPAVREQCRIRGWENVQRFTTSRMVAQYVESYRALLEQPELSLPRAHS